MLFSYWHYLFIMFPIPRIKVDSSINTVHDNGCRMIQFWINTLKIKEMVWSPNKIKHCCFSTHRCLQPLGFKLTLLLILLNTLASGWSGFGSNIWNREIVKSASKKNKINMFTWVFNMILTPDLTWLFHKYRWFTVLDQIHEEGEKLCIQL